MEYEYSNQKEIEELELIKAELIDIPGYEKELENIKTLIIELYGKSFKSPLIESTDMDEYYKNLALNNGWGY